MTRQTDSKVPGLTVEARDHTQGPKTAPVTLVQYGSYEGSGCRRVHTLVQEARRRLGNRLRFVFRHFVPSDGRLPARHAAEVVEASGAQGRFWEMHGMLSSHEGALNNGHLVEYANALGLDITQLLRDMADHVHAGRLREDLESGMQSGVHGTPTFFINGVRHDPPWDAETLLAAIEDEAAAQEDMCDGKVVDHAPVRDRRSADTQQ